MGWRHPRIGWNIVVWMAEHIRFQQNYRREPREEDQEHVNVLQEVIWRESHPLLRRTVRTLRVRATEFV